METPGSERSQGVETCNEKSDGTGGMMRVPERLRDLTAADGAGPAGGEEQSIAV